MKRPASKNGPRLSAKTPRLKLLFYSPSGTKNKGRALDTSNVFLLPQDDYSYSHDETQQETHSHLNQNDSQDGEASAPGRIFRGRRGRDGEAPLGRLFSGRRFGRLSNGGHDGEALPGSLFRGRRFSRLCA